MMPANAFVAAGSATQPQRFVIAEADSLAETRPDSAWISAADPVEVRR